MAMLNNLSSMSNLTQRVLSQSNNVAYSLRGIERVRTVPEDRKAEYLFRDFVMTLVMGYLTELSFRTTETLYTMPAIVDQLELNRLPQLYNKGGELSNQVHGYFDTSTAYKRLPQGLQSRILGSLVREDSNYLIPRLLRSVSKTFRLEGNEKELSKTIQDEALLHHLDRRLDFKNYVEKTLVALHEKTGGDNGISAKDSQRVLGVIEQFEGSVKERAASLAHKKPKGFSLNLKAFKEVSEELTEKIKTAEAETLAKLDEAIEAVKGSNGTSNAKAILKDIGIEGFDDSADLERIKVLVVDYFKGEGAKNTMKRFQKSSAWFKMGVSVVFNLVGYGLIANKFDFEKIQPWQEKLYQKRGTTQEVVKPAYLSLIPGVAVMTLASKLNLVKRLSYFNRFAVAGGLGLATFAASWKALFEASQLKPAPGSKNGSMPKKDEGELPFQPLPRNPWELESIVNQPTTPIQHVRGFNAFEQARR